MNCIFCKNESTKLIKLKKTYAQCSCCGGIFLLKDFFTTPQAQKERYLMHSNSLKDLGYKIFLLNFINPVRNFLEGINYLPKTILDYGSGPEPCLVELMNQSIFVNADIRGWDPFFAPETPFFDAGADLVTCLEVIEHFEAPFENFVKLKNSCKKGGYIAIGTMFLTNDIDFNKWWYKEDSTHVSFYTFDSIKELCKRVGIDCVLQQERLAIFKVPE